MLFHKVLFYNYQAYFYYVHDSLNRGVDVMDNLDCLREELHSVIDSGDKNTILAVSQELDKLIVSYTKLSLSLERKCV